ncbi:MAG: serine/threonine protein kinase [Myxococcales bacterium]|nr:serine/threonine protein kinase [Myxococcales bacterium]
MARVDLAVRDGSRDPCVLKQMLRQLDGHRDARIRFVREARLASMLDHPNIARLIEATEIDDRLLIASEWVFGVTVEDIQKTLWSAGTSLRPALALGIATQMLHALAHAHALRDEEGREVGLVHRDLSTKNLMVGFDGVVKIIDFGVARGAVDDHRTATGMLMGTPLYMSPEQATGLRVDRRSDLYTVGVVLWEMLAGRRLIRVKGRPNMLLSVVRDVAPPIRTLCPEAPPELESALSRALAKHPDERFPDALSFHRALIPAVAAMGVIEPPDLGRFLKELLPAREGEQLRLLSSARALSEEVEEGTAVSTAFGSLPSTHRRTATRHRSAPGASPRRRDPRAPESARAPAP